MRALLNLISENKAAEQEQSLRFRELLRIASLCLQILDPDHGEEELIQSVAAELAKLSQPLRQPSTLNPETDTPNPKPSSPNTNP